MSSVQRIGLLVAVVVATLVVYLVTQCSVQEEAETQAHDEAREEAWKTRITAGPYLQVCRREVQLAGKDSDGWWGERLRLLGRSAPEALGPAVTPLGCLVLATASVQ